MSSSDVGIGKNKLDHDHSHEQAGGHDRDHEHDDSHAHDNSLSSPQTSSSAAATATTTAAATTDAAASKSTSTSTSTVASTAAVKPKPTKSHAHGHGHGHSHVDVREQSRSRMIGALIMLALFMVVEAITGFTCGSLALLADAGHMLGDVAGLSLALLAIWFSSKPATPGNTYGYYRSEILAGFLNSLALVGISLFIMYHVDSGSSGIHCEYSFAQAAQLICRAVNQCEGCIPRDSQRLSSICRRDYLYNSDNGLSN
jgi:hypothetical protein